MRVMLVTFVPFPAIVRAQKKKFQEYLTRVATGIGAPETRAAQLAILAEGALTTAAIAGSAESGRQARAATEVLIDAPLHPWP